MPKIAYIQKNFRSSTANLIQQAQEIIKEYRAQGFSLTLRQVYYQMVARALIPNTVQSYKRLGKTIADARLAGLIDWLAIVDRTRSLRDQSHWTHPHEILSASARQYRIDKWVDQPCRVEVWIEKDALIGVIGGVCQELHVPYFSCRGYTSASAMWRAGQRLFSYIEDGQDPIILHFGDHDPSGMDMTRDIADRLEMFAEATVEINRVALNMDQVDEHQPPPNPAKLSDSRAGGYIRIYGHDSWELDALEPATIVSLIKQEVLAVRDEAAWAQRVELEEAHREILKGLVDAARQ